MYSYSKSNGVIEKNLLLFSILVGLFFRIYFIFKLDFWFDESFTFFIANLPLNQVVSTVLNDNNPPLYYLIMHFVARFTHLPALLRLPSLLFNITAGFFLYQVVAPLNKKAAIFSVALFCLSPLTIYLAATARLHALGLLMALLIVWQFQRVLRTPTRAKKIQFVLISLIGVYTQYYIGLLFIALTLLILKKPSHFPFKNWLFLLMLIVIGFLPWVVAQSREVNTLCACPPTYYSLPATLISPVLGGIGEVTIRRFISLPSELLLFFSIGVILNFYLFWKGIYKNTNLLVFIYSISLIIICIVGMVGPYFSPKGFSIYGSLFLGIVAIGITTFKKSRKIIFLNCIILISISLIQIINPIFSGTPISPIVSSINSNPTIPIAHLSSFTYYPIKFYLPTATQTLLTTNPFSKNITDSIGGTPISELPRPTFWLVDTEEWVDAEIRNTQLARISNEYTMAQEFNFSKVSIKLWELKQAQHKN